MHARPSVLAHGTSRTGRWLRARRLRIALGIAVVEGLLVVLGVIPGWTAVLAAAAVILVYLLVGRRARSHTLRQASWVAAASQVLVALVPVLVLVVGALAIVAVAVLAAVALLVLFAGRR